VDNTGLRDDGAAQFFFMTVDELILETLNKIRNFFYADRTREFKRDERALMKAILRYGHECYRRGWEFDAEFIYCEVARVLQAIRSSGAEIKYLPVYLDGAMKRAVGGRSEELQIEAKSRRADPIRLVVGLTKVDAVREPSGAEICSRVFEAVRQQRKKKLKRHVSKQKTFLY